MLDDVLPPTIVEEGATSSRVLMLREVEVGALVREEGLTPSQLLGFDIAEC